MRIGFSRRASAFFATRRSLRTRHSPSRRNRESSGHFRGVSGVFSRETEETAMNEPDLPITNEPNNESTTEPTTEPQTATPRRPAARRESLRAAGPPSRGAAGAETVEVPFGGSSADARSDGPAAPPPARLHDLPMPITWDLFGSLRRHVPPPLSDTLFSIFDLAVCRTMLHEELPEDGRPQRAVERWIRGFAPCRREWLEVAHEAVGDAGLTPLRVEALALARGMALRVRWDTATRTDIEFVLGEEGRILSEYGVAVRQGRPLDHRRLRILSTRLDYCVTAALLAETDGCFGGLRTATPLLCAEARIAAAELRRIVAPPCGRRPVACRTQRTARKGGAATQAEG